MSQLLKIRAFFGLLLVLLLGPAITHAASSPEEQDFSLAFRLFQGGMFTLAETNFSSFLSAYTNSSHHADAVLYLGRARVEESNYDGAIDLLQKWVPRAGDLAGDYVFWIARARFDKGDYARAAEGFDNLLKNFPNAPRLLEAAYDEADAYAKLQNWPRTVALLREPGSPFRVLAAADPKNQFASSGQLLLAEALWAEGHFAEGETVINALDPVALTPESQWQRQYLLCRLQMADGKLDDALQNSTNLLDAGFGPRHRAASRFLRAELMEKLGHPADALQSYTNNLADDLPPEVQRQALLKTVELTLAQNQGQDAVALLEGYVAQRPHSPALDLARLSLGELYLKIYYKGAIPAGTTNYLQLALTNFDSLLHDFPRSALAPKAHLDRGWCYWTQKKIEDAKNDFQAAAEQLPFSPDQAVARFKLADTEFYQQNYAAALAGYNSVLERYSNLQSVTNGLFDQALYQIIEASLASGDQEGALDAMKRILAWYPNSLFGDRGQLLIGEDRKYDYSMARRVFSDLLKRSPNTPILSEVQYAVARTYEQEGDWQGAIAAYNQWVAHYPASLRLPQVEFSRALAYEKAGLETNALTLFTNFVTRFSSNALAPMAQNWVADFYFNHEDYTSAEKNYEELYEKFPGAGDVAYQAHFWAGRSALARQDIDEARKYFSDLVSDTNAPSSLTAQGYFALGDTILQQFQGNPTNGIYLDDAIAAISKLTNGAPTNAIAAEAFGRLGDYYMQWGDLRHDSTVFTNVVQMYQTVLNFPATNVDVATRCQAEVGLGQVAERQGRPADALAHYCKVIYGYDPANFDPFWVEQAGVFAARLCEDQHQWDKAIDIYKRVLEAVPSLRASLEKKIAAAQTHAEEARN